LNYKRESKVAGDNVLFLFENFALDCERRELRAHGAIIPVEPQVFDLLVYLIENRDRVVSKDDLIASVWSGRIVSDSTLDSRINSVRKALCWRGQHGAEAPRHRCDIAGDAEPGGALLHRV
jgi:DNA-binding winged helix-turn-helix (wHTH) protein